MVQPGCVFYDVGANVGFVSVLAARCAGPSGHVIAIEPLPANLRWVRHNFKINGFEHDSFHEVALGDRNGSADFLLSEHPLLGKLSGCEKSHEAIGETIVVPIRTLDVLRAEAGLPVPNVIKIDVEGAEADVLRGAAQTIRESCPLLMIELHGTNKAVAEVLETLGYIAMALGPHAGILDTGPSAMVLAAHADDAAGVEKIEKIGQSSRAIR